MFLFAKKNARAIIETAHKCKACEKDSTAIVHYAKTNISNVAQDLDWRLGKKDVQIVNEVDDVRLPEDLQACRLFLRTLRWRIGDPEFLFCNDYHDMDPKFF